MLLSPIVIASAERKIKVVASLAKDTILDVDGELRVLGAQDGGEEWHAELGIGQKGKGEEGGGGVKALLEVHGGRGGIAALLRDGGILALMPGKDIMWRYRKSGGQADQLVEHLAFGLYPPRVAVVTRHQPELVNIFASWTVFLTWLEQGGEADAGSVVGFESEVVEMVGNLEGFTVLLRGGQAYTLTPTATMTQQLPQAPSAAAATATAADGSVETLQDHEAEGSEEETDLYALLSDIPSSTLPQPVNTFSTTPILLPAKKTRIATHPLARVTGLVTADSEAYLLSPPSFAQAGPTLPSLSSPQDLQPITLPERREVDTDEGVGARIVSLALGRSHALVLTEGGVVWSAGDGVAGQLGVGERVRKMRATGRGRVEFHPMDEEPLEWAEEWQRVDVGKVREVWAGEETGFFLVEGGVKG
ncbi:MAG: hypothetical protein Q9190_001526 [Brigantiaea leucoxantha]